MGVRICPGCASNTPGHQPSFWHNQVLPSLASPTGPGEPKPLCSSGSCLTIGFGCWLTACGPDFGSCAIVAPGQRLSRGLAASRTSSPGALETFGRPIPRGVPPSPRLRAFVPSRWICPVASWTLMSEQSASQLEPDHAESESERQNGVTQRGEFVGCQQIGTARHPAR